MTISGTSGVTYAADCVFSDGNGDKRIALAGPVPDVHEFVGTGVRCRFQRTGGTGKLEVEVRKGSGTVSRSTITGVNIPITIAVQ